MEGFRQTGLADNLLTGLVGLFLVAVVDPDRSGRMTAVAAAAVTAAAAAAAAVDLWVVAGGWRTLSARSPRVEKSRPSTEVMSSSLRTGNVGRKELLQLQ